MQRARAAVVVALMAVLMLGGSPAGDVTNGEETGTAYANVGGIVAYFEGYGTGILCTSTLIAPDVFLTAAHCLVGLEGITILGVTFDPVFLDLTDPVTVPIYGVAGTTVNPDYPTDGSYDPYTDIGVILLSEPVTGIEPAQLPVLGQLDPLQTRRGLQDTSFTIVGYGIGELSHVGGQVHPVAEPGVRRLATANLININRGIAGETLIQFTNNRGGGKGGTCYGDSGGALFLGDSTTIIGITSGGNNRFCTGGWGIDYRLDTPEAYAFLDDYVTLPVATDTASDATTGETTGRAAVQNPGLSHARQEAIRAVEAVSLEVVNEQLVTKAHPGQGHGREQAPGQAEQVIVETSAPEPAAIQSDAVETGGNQGQGHRQQAPAEQAAPVAHQAVSEGGHGQDKGQGQGESQSQNTEPPVVIDETAPGASEVEQAGPPTETPDQGHGREQAPGQTKDKD